MILGSNCVTHLKNQLWGSGNNKGANLEWVNLGLVSSITPRCSTKSDDRFLRRPCICIEIEALSRS